MNEIVNSKLMTQIKANKNLELTSVVGSACLRRLTKNEKSNFPEHRPRTHWTNLPAEIRTASGMQKRRRKRERGRVASARRVGEGDRQSMIIYTNFKRCLMLADLSGIIAVWLLTCSNMAYGRSTFLSICCEIYADPSHKYGNQLHC